ncbi:hypothetical protein OESDEN_00933 [Oesophagostomum dentatum]|uniref:Uncharacterized protein n=1 Tax=Oesophagostomum dentatum TaxID=61180 RepID=A0A0B1TSK2_OESDE|nr:hypothetical protein OESDEN_00933 [Oesophagostomum dentatum]
MLVEQDEKRPPACASLPHSTDKLNLSGSTKESLLDIAKRLSITLVMYGLSDWQLTDRTHVAEDNTLPETPTDTIPSVVFPPTINDVFPVLYQVIARGHGQRLVLEAKDFFIMGPDHKELHCIILDQYATNITSNTRGFDPFQISLKDFVWVYAVKPTPQALWNPDEVLRQACLPRRVLLDTQTPYFFRVDRFTFVTPPAATRRMYGIVLEVVRRGRRINNLRIAFEGTPEVITVSPKVCRFPLDTIQPDNFVVADARPNQSTAIRFSEPPLSDQNVTKLATLVRNVIPAHPSECILPLCVYRVGRNTLDWLEHRLGPFTNYGRDPPAARKEMARVFNASCSALAAINLLNDHRQTHAISASVPSLTAFPIRVHFDLTNMTAECGWTNLRPVHMWIANSRVVARMIVHHSSYDFDTRTLSVQLATTIGHHRSVLRALRKRARPDDDSTNVDICVRLGPPPTGSDPVYEQISRDQLFANLTTQRTCLANRILDAIYSGQYLTHPAPTTGSPG